MLDHPGVPSLREVIGPAPGTVYSVWNGCVLGRDSTTDVTIMAAGVSRRHAQIILDREGGWLQDLGSSNGTFVNGKRITRHLLAEGDTITVGDVQLRWSLAEAPRRAPPVSPAAQDPPTEPFNVAFARQLLLDDEADTLTEEQYSFDAHRTFAMDLQVKPTEQVAALQQRLKLMFEVSQALAVVKQRDELLGKILETLFAVFPQAERGQVLLGPSVDRLHPALVRDKRNPGERTRAAISRTVARKVFEQKKAILCHDVGGDARFATARSLVDFSVTAFMVAPLLYREEVYGFIQLEAQRHFAPDDLNLLAGLAASAALFLKNLELFESVAREVKEREAIHSELRIASRIQSALLPRSDPNLPWLEMSGRTRPAKEVGGDYFDWVPGPRGELFVVIGDVSGKGVPAGLVMVMARSIIHSLVARPDVATDPLAVAVETNRLLKKDLKPGMFLSLLLGLCDDARRTLRFAACGHEKPLVFRAATGAVETLELGGTVLGVVTDNSRNVGVAEVRLDPGDQVLLYTDGVTEALSKDSQQFGLARLGRTLASHGRRPPAQLLEAIEAELRAHTRGADQHDDITLIALRRR